MEIKALRSITIGLSITVVAIAMVWHQTAIAEAVAAKGELSPAEAPVLRVGHKEVWRYKDGRESTSEVVSVDGENVSWQTSEGCDWTKAGIFGPWLKWSKGCGGSAGTHTIKSQKGNIFPLQVGNTVRWKLRGKNNRGHTWSRTRRCSVKATANVTVPAGNFDTYEVVCTTQRTREVWYFSPELGTGAKYRSKNSKWNSELVGVTLGPE